MDPEEPDEEDELSPELDETKLRARLDDRSLLRIHANSQALSRREERRVKEREERAPLRSFKSPSRDLEFAASRRRYLPSISSPSHYSRSLVRKQGVDFEATFPQRRPSTFLPSSVELTLSLDRKSVV